MESRGCAPYRVGTTCIGLERQGELVAGTAYDFCNGASIVASIAIAGPITRKWLWFIFAYPFIQLKANVIIGLISGDNQKSIHLAERMGFKSACDIPHADPSGLLCVYTMHRDDCRFLKGY
jgi:RimJ/RimL family protein N-acetyltransferase